MIVDERKHIRENGFRKIINARKLAFKTERIRCFRSPKNNFQATDYIEIIDWNTTAFLPPPLLRRVLDETADKWNFDKFPCHTQVVEHCVKLVIEA